MIAASLHMRLRNCQQLSGFSLLEMAIVVMILGILTSIATPMYFHALARGRVDAASRKIIADLAMVKSAAEVSSSARTIQFSSVNDGYTAVGVQDFDRPLSEYQLRVGSAPYWTNLVSVDFGGNESLVFDGFGRPDSAGTIVLQSGNLQRTIVVDAVTGEGVVQ
jgi:prepilin-type N-terminal cleavage/methylation domain-containing protein